MALSQQITMFHLHKVVVNINVVGNERQCCRIILFAGNSCLFAHYWLLLSFINQFSICRYSNWHDSEAWIIATLMIATMIHSPQIYVKWLLFKSRSRTAAASVAKRGLSSLKSVRGDVDNSTAALLKEWTHRNVHLLYVCYIKVFTNNRHYSWGASLLNI